MQSTTLKLYTKNNYIKLISDPVMIRLSICYDNNILINNFIMISKNYDTYKCPRVPGSINC